MPINFCSTAGELLLYFNGAQVGAPNPTDPAALFKYQWIESYKSTPRLATPVKVRNNYWSDRVYLDGRNPALSHEHVFTCYFESNSRILFTQGFYTNLSSIFNDQPLHLEIVTPQNSLVAAGQQLVDFGLCYAHTSPVLRDPTEFLLYRAAFIDLSFLGTDVPVVHPG